MAPTKRTSSQKTKSNGLPTPFKQAPETLRDFCASLSTENVYIAHVDYKPWALKRKIFMVPVLMNVAAVVLFFWRLQYIGPYYIKLFTSALGYANETTTVAAELPWPQLLSVVLGRALNFLLDFVLTVFIWPWPVEFCLGQAHGNPVAWRWHVGFRDQEIYVRRSRIWDRGIGDVLVDDDSRHTLLSRVHPAMSPTLLRDKTGYLTMNGDWDLDWAAMVQATALVDRKSAPLDAFRAVVLLHNSLHGWLCLDLRSGDEGEQDERRRQVFAFRDALAAEGKEDLFFRWVEIVQFESSRPGGTSPENQAQVAEQIRDLFAAEGIDFDQFWADKVGTANPSDVP